MTKKEEKIFYEMMNNNILVTVENVLIALKYKQPLWNVGPTPNKELNQKIQELVEKYK